MKTIPISDAAQLKSAYHHTPGRPDDVLAGVGKGTPCGEWLRRYWQPVGVSREVTTRPQMVRILGEELVLFRDKSGRAGLLYPRCMHRGTNLYYGKVEEQGIRCCYHGWLFSVEGHCLQQPCEPNGGANREVARQPWYPVEERYGPSRSWPISVWTRPCSKSSQNGLQPSQCRDLMPELMQRFDCSQRNALRAVKKSASIYLYQAVKKDEQGLSLRLKRPRRNKPAKLRQPKHVATAVNEIWSMDFVADALFDGRKLRMLSVVGQTGTRERQRRPRPGHEQSNLGGLHGQSMQARGSIRR